MLLSFSVSNHKSIRDEQTLHLQPVYDKSRPALPVAAIFGANAAGKSNLLDALSFMTDAVHNSFGWRDGVPRSPFLLDGESPGRESAFTVELLLDGVRWVYGFTVDYASVRKEWLHTYPQQRRRTVFERAGQSVDAGATGGLRPAMVRNVGALLPHTALFLSMMTGHPAVAPVQRWFDQVNSISAPVASVDEDSLIERLQDDPDRGRLVRLLVAADVGIADIEVEYLLPRDVTPDRPPGVLRRSGPVEVRLLFLHGSDRAPMSLADESHGTRVWLSYLGPVLDALESGGLLVVDEIDTSLHPNLTVQLIRLFQDAENNPRGAQLVFTTHDATLLGKHFNDRILARDEVWFAEKTIDQKTTLYSLAEFKVREAENVQRRYLTGTYGAIPQPDDHSFDDAMGARPA